MKVTLWGTRGSLATPGPETQRYGGNTSCVQVQGADGTTLILDAGTGIRRLGTQIATTTRRVDLLLTHLHMDHIQGLGFFAPLYNPDAEVHIWGPRSMTLTLRERLVRYLSPPLFPVLLRDLPCQLHLHELPGDDFTVGQIHVSSMLVCHPNPTVGYRISSPEGVVTYLPDHEPALGPGQTLLSRDWTSGYALAADADLLIHDSQYARHEYASHVGWGHSSLDQALAFAELAGAKHFVPFHHDPGHDDVAIDGLIATAVAAANPSFRVTPGTEGATFGIPNIK